MTIIIKDENINLVHYTSTIVSMKTAINFPKPISLEGMMNHRFNGIWSMSQGTISSCNI